MEAFQDIILRHEKRAFEFSGGKDSTAALYYLRPFWPDITVYWCNTGRPAPEVQEHVYRVRDQLPNFVEVAGRRDQVWREYGWPSDLIPIHFVPMGLMVRGDDKSPPIQGRYDCCARSLMNPLHERVMADGNTLVIRGQKNSDPLKSVLRNGSVLDGIEYLFPIEDWTDLDVWNYLGSQRIRVPDSYSVLGVSPDCIDCTAWWGEGRSLYLRERHPLEYNNYLVRLRYIRAAIREHLNELDREVT